jgi:predicted CoA-substrate-specific enzyme activase
MASLGIDIGCISLKAALAGEAEDCDLFSRLLAEHPDLFQPPRDGLTVVGGRPVLVTAYRRIKGGPAEATQALLDELTALLPAAAVGGLRVTGSGARLVGEALGATFENEFKAITRGVSSLHPEAQTIFEMGGETSKFIRLEAACAGACGGGIADYQTNGDCAAGTGSFMDQQASRLLYEIEDVGDIVLGAGKAASIAGRCSVFAKSDMIHAQQKGYEPPEVLRGLCDAVVRNFKGTIAKGKIVQPPVAFIGGVAANKGAVQALREAFDFEDGSLFVPEYHYSMGAIGAALLEADAGVTRASGALDATAVPAGDFPVTEPLSMDDVLLLRDMARPYQWPADGRPVDVFMGIDVGSVSTNFVVLDEAGEVIKEIYVKTDARPVEVVNAGLAEVHAELGDRIVLRGVGTTGSGRELIGELTGADIVTDEITAHKTGADFVGRRIDRQVDTIFEIGGQDSKFISLQDGIVVDFAMNEACAAGTGSFLEEQAEKLGIDIKGQFARMALSSPAPIRLGERCTVFMERDVMAYQQRGARREDLVAGLAFSIAYNYLNRLVRERRVGDCIFFQGGTAYNDSVAAAFSQILGKQIIVPPHNGVIGALGMALLARERIGRTGAATTFRGWDLEQVDYTVLDFVCKGCSNECDVRQFTVEGQKTYWGDKCSDRYRKPAKVDKQPVIEDLIMLREEALLAPYHAAVERAAGATTTVGIPRSMYTYDRLPYWATFFAELGVRPVLSPESDKAMREVGVELTVAEPCFPIRVAHGHVDWLLREGVDHVFVPNQISEETEFPQFNSHACPWGQTLPFVVRAAPRIEDQRDKLLTPRVRFRLGREELVRDLREVGARLGADERRVRAALDAAARAQDEFRTTLLAAGARALATLEETGEPGIVLVGRPYNMYDKGITMDIPRKLRKFYGVNVIPLDFLPIRGIDITDIVPNMYWNYGRKILQTARFVGDRPRLHLIYMTNFKCGPDSYIKHYVREASGKPYLTLQFDEHQNDAGAMTRCEAYLDSKGFLRWWTQEGAQDCAPVPAEEVPLGRV